MTRRGGRRNSRVARRAAIDQLELVLALAAGRPVFCADNYEVDGVSGKVAAFVDLNDSSRKLVQATSANQVALPAAHADFGGKLCATFTGAEVYASNQAVAFWTFLHDGVGVGLWTVSTQTSTVGNQIVVSTRGGIGLTAYTLNTADDPRLLIGQPASAVDLAATGSVNVPRQVRFRFTSPNWAFKVTGSVEATGVQAAAPTSANAAQTLQFGTGFIGRWRWIICAPDVGATSAGFISAFLTSDTGVAA